MEKFVFNGIPKVYFGCNCLEESLKKEINNIGNNIMLVYGKKSVKENGIYDRILKILLDNEKKIIDFSGVMSNPTYKKVQEGTKLAKDNNVNYIIAIGGGSVIDCAKIISAQSLLEEDIWDLEINKNIKPTNFIPMASIVTLSGTGSEMNNKGVITNELEQRKCSLVGAISDFVILDPILSLTVSNKQFLSGAFDTLSHLMETYFGKPLEDNVSDSMNEGLMKNVIKNMKNFVINPDSLIVRSELMWASSMAESGLLMLGKSTDFQCHQISHQLAVYTNCNHGESLALLHPKLYRSIYKNGVDKFVSFAKNVWKINDENTTDEKIALLGIEALEKFIDEIGLPKTFRDMNIYDYSYFNNIAKSTIIKEGCMKQLTSDEILEILESCI